MLKCRKNFANLLLLSVMLFLLGVSAVPCHRAGLPDVTLNVPSGSGELQWVNHSGTIVYIGQQTIAIAGESFVWKPVDLLENLFLSCSDSASGGDLQQVCDLNFAAKHLSRAPPVC